MAIELSSSDHKAIDDFIDAILDAYRAGTITQVEARVDLAHAIATAARGSEDLKSYVRIPPVEKWTKK